MTLKDYLLLTPTVVVLSHQDFWYYHSPEKDIFLNAIERKAYHNLDFQTNIALWSQLNISWKYPDTSFTILDQRGHIIYEENLEHDWIVQHHYNKKLKATARFFSGLTVEYRYSYNNSDNNEMYEGDTWYSFSTFQELQQYIYDTEGVSMYAAKAHHDKT